jgi:MFS family permease
MFYMGILLHGICYDFFFVTGQIYVDKKAPLEIRASAQGFIAFVTLGVGMVIGNLINGWVTEHYKIVEMINGEEAISHNWRPIWIIPAIMAIAVAVGFALLFKENNNTAQAVDAGGQTEELK